MAKIAKEKTFNLRLMACDDEINGTFSKVMINCNKISKAKQH